MVSFRGRSAFYGRTSAGKYQLDVEQLRSAFDLSQSTRERIRDFRAERIAQIAAGETPMELARMPVVVVHVMPLVSFESDRSLGSRELAAAFTMGKTMPAYSDGAWNSRLNYEGLLIYEVLNDQKVPSYLQVFRTGVIESVSSEPMNNNNNNSVASAFFEGSLIGVAIPRYLTALQAVAVPPPVFVGVSLIGAEKFSMALPSGPFRERTHTFDKEVLIVPPIMLERYDTNLAMAMRLIFDSLWNAVGRYESPYYDGDEWKGMRKFNNGASPF